MFKRLRWLLVVAVLLLVPITGMGQNTEVPPVSFTGIFSHPRFDDGGIYTGFTVLYWNTNRPLRPQTVAIRGIFDFDGSISGTKGTFIGSGEEALNTEQLMGPSSAQPGWDLFIGWRFQGGVAIELDWKHLYQARYHAQANILAPNFDVGTQFENTFFFSQVSNFSTVWAGPGQKIPAGDAAATFGIWNGASAESIEFVQRFDIYQINVRMPIWETSDYRSYGLFGPRIAWVWDQFRWTATATDQTGNSGPQDTAIYSNTVSNRMYGMHFGFGHDWKLGTNPMGAFSFEFDLEGALYINMVKTSAAYDLADRSASSSRSRRFTTLVPGVDARANLKWYVWEAITFELGYDMTTFFNTISSHRPIDFNLGQVDAAYNTQIFRWFYGFHVGVNFVF